MISMLKVNYICEKQRWYNCLFFIRKRKCIEWFPVKVGQNAVFLAAKISAKLQQQDSKHVKNKSGMYSNCSLVSFFIQKRK